MSQPQPEQHSNNAPYTAPKPDPRIVRHLTWDEIMYFIDHDGDKFFEDVYLERQFDMAIDLDPEIE